MEVGLGGGVQGVEVEVGVQTEEVVGSDPPPPLPSL